MINELNINNFTKEELQIISRDIEKFQESLFKIRGKVLEMIDNYCEHENSGPDYCCNRCWDCGKCW